MGTIKDEAANYKAKSSVSNISELKEIDTNLVIFEETEAEFPYRYIEANGIRYRMPDSVLAALQAILRSNPKISKFKVDKSGTGMNTKYVVIHLG